jgi:hypothetical protein
MIGGASSAGRALVVTGLLTLAPRRIMNTMVFGG